MPNVSECATPEVSAPNLVLSGHEKPLGERLLKAIGVPEVPPCKHVITAPVSGTACSSKRTCTHPMSAFLCADCGHTLCSMSLLSKVATTALGDVQLAWKDRLAATLATLATLAWTVR